MKSIIVIGYGRSGTSLTSDILHQLGVNMGPPRSWRPADSANQKGYFENTAFVRANQSILEQNRTPDLRSIVEAYQSDLWGCKDPRFLWTWGEWEPFIKNPHFIICRRRPSSIAKSLEFYDGKEPAKFIKEIKAYYRKAKRIKYKKLEIYYEDYFKSDENIKKIAKFVGVPYKKIDAPDITLKHF